MAEPQAEPRPTLLDRTPRIAAILLGIVVVNLLFHVTVVRRFARASGDSAAILDDARSKLQATATDLDHVERASSRYACSVADTHLVFDTELSSKAERLTAILREVRKLVRDNRLDADRLQYSVEPVGKTSLVQFSISFPLQGPYQMLRSFIREVEASQEFLFVRDISLDGDRAAGDNLHLQVTVSTFFVDPDPDRLQAAFRSLARRSS